MTATEVGGPHPLPQSVGAPGMTAFARFKSILGGASGNLVEWYDWFAYATLAIYFAPLFFPEGDQTSQLLKVAAIYAVGFAARPLGAWLLGLYADRRGRRSALSLSVALMCLGSLLIAIAPTYAVIGTAAPVMLLLARILQGISVGGEYGSSATYLSEMAGRERRGFWSSFQFVTLIMGQLLALGVLVLLQRFMDPVALGEWGWRIPFFIGAALAVVVFWIRRGIAESSSYENSKKTGQRGTTLRLIKEHPRQALIVMGITATAALTYYTFTTYMQKFLTNTSGFSKETAANIMTGALVIFMLVQPLVGWLSDKIGRRPLLIVAFGGAAITVVPIMTALQGASDPMLAFVLVTAALLNLSCYTGVAPATFSELYPAHIRALGVALPYAIANAAFGGTAEYVALKFKAQGVESGFYVYVAIIAAVGCLTAILMRDTKKHSQILED